MRKKQRKKKFFWLPFSVCPQRGHSCITAGLDLRTGIMAEQTTSKWSHNRHLSLFHYWMVNHVRPLWGRAFLSLSQSAGQTRGSFSAVLRKRASSSDAPVTPLGVKLFLVPLFLCLKEIMASPRNDKRVERLDMNDVSAG